MTYVDACFGEHKKYKLCVVFGVSIVTELHKSHFRSNSLTCLLLHKLDAVLMRAGGRRVYVDESAAKHTVTHFPQMAMPMA